MKKISHGQSLMSMSKWRDEFYLPVALNSFNSLSDNGFLLTNIMDPKVKGVRHRSGDELVDSLHEHWLGQVGMRIMQRPQGKNVSLRLTKNLWSL